MELTQEQSLAADFLSEQSNILTREGKSGKWRDNVVKNREYFCKGNPDLTGLYVYSVAAGPSLEKNVQHLKKVSKRGVIVCVEAAFRFLLKNGVIPEYCVCVDGSEKMLRMVEGCKTDFTTLVCTPSASPELLDYWKGPKFFVTTPYMQGDRKYNHFHLTRIVKAEHDIKKGDELFLGDDYNVEFEGVSDVIICGGNVSTATHHFSYAHLRARKVILVGHDLSWEYESNHYAGKEHKENVKDRTQAGVGVFPDLNKKDVNTNMSLLGFKRFHETLAKQQPGSIVNATEGGILGVEQDGKRCEYIDFMTLEEAVAKFTPKDEGKEIDPKDLFVRPNGNKGN